MRAMISSVPARAAQWLRQGISPSRLALTLALGFAIGCIPVIGLPTVLCACLALILRLNLPAIQAANYAAMPLQMVLIVPFVRLGDRLFAGPRNLAPVAAITPGMSLQWVVHIGGLAGNALLAWLLVAGPAVAVMTVAFRVVLRRFTVPARQETTG